MARQGEANHAGNDSPVLVSVCTVTFERHPFLPLLEQCLINQDYPHDQIEWIIIDDTQQQHECLRFRRAESTGIQIKYIQCPSRLRLGAKRNLSHQHCEGDIIVYMDDDDYYPPSRIGHAVHTLLGSNCDIAGCSELPILLVPERTVWMTHSLGPSHATANTLAFRREYLRQHSFDPEATEATEASFLDHFTASLVSLDPLKTITCIGHSRNTVDKRHFITSTQGLGISRIHAKRDQFIPTSYLESYCGALAEIEAQFKQGIETAAPRIPINPSPANSKHGLETDHRIAVITPYYREDVPILRRCHESVKRQSMACTHFLIADGPGLTELDSWDCRHVRLGTGHADNGNTPRSIGALCAMNEGFTCITYLDADNWFLPDHLTSVLQLQRETGCEVVFTGREVVFPDGELIPQLDAEDISLTHADTSTIVVFTPAFKSLSIWAQMPQELGPYCDRVAFHYLTSHFHCAWTKRCTVIFETWYDNHFMAAGKLIPANAKFLPAKSRSEWQAVGKRFRERSHTPYMPPWLRIAPEKTRINLISVLGPLGCGAYEIQQSLSMLMTFFGLPPNDFLWHWQQAFGMDCNQRLGGGLILEGLRRTFVSTSDANPCFVHAIAKFESAISLDRSFNILEAYFRLIQVLMSTRCRDFARSFGLVNVLDRSHSLSLASEMLFDLLPMHRALLVVDAPISQISRLLAISEQSLLSLESEHLNALIQDLCHQYLDSLITPLEASPRNQLLIIERTSYLTDPSKGMKRIVSWLDHETLEWPKGLVEIIDTGGVVNCTYQEEMIAVARAVDQEILFEKPPPTSPDAEKADLEAHLSFLGSMDFQPKLSNPAQRLALMSLFKPLDKYIYSHNGFNSGLGSGPSTEEQVQLQPIIEDQSLVIKVERLCTLLQRRLYDDCDHVWQASQEARDRVEP